MSISIEINDQVTPAVDVLSRLLSGEDPDLLEAAAAGAAEELRGHLEKRDAKANRLGGKRTHYWNDVAASTFHEVRGKQIRIGVDHVGAALHYYGGTVTPKRAKFLTIPADPKAHGRRAAEFGNLVPVFFGKGTPGAKSFGALIVDDGDDETFDVMYWLTKKSEIEADKSVLPKDNDLIEAATDAAEDALEAFNE